MNTQTKRKIEYLTTLSLEGVISESEQAQLKELLNSSPSCVEYYSNYIAIASSLNRPEPFIREFEPRLNETKTLPDASIWMALAEAERTAQAVAVETERRSKQTVTQNISVPGSTKSENRRISRFLVAITAMSSAALLMIFALPLISPRREPVAMLGETMNPVWENENSLATGDVLRQGELALQSGYARVFMDSGAELVLRGPVSLTLETDNSVLLNQGKVFSVVPKRAQGFTVDTPEAQVIDYGTEFGVAYDPLKGTTTQVFKGQVGVSARNSMLQSGEKRLFANQAATVASSGTIRTARFDPDVFATDIPTMYRLAVLENAPVAYWQMQPDKLKSSVLANGSTPELQYVGEVGFTSGPDLGQGVTRSAIQLSGNGYAMVPNMKSVDQKGASWSVSMWIRPEFSRLTAPDDDSSRYFILSGEGRYGYIVANAAGSLSHFYYSSGHGLWARQDVDNVLDSGKWHHLAVIADGSTKSIYLDGENVARDPMLVPANDTQSSAGFQPLGGSGCEELFIGSIFEQGRAYKKNNADKSFVGSIAEVTIYNHALTAQAVNSLYTASRRNEK